MLGRPNTYPVINHAKHGREEHRCNRCSPWLPLTSHRCRCGPRGAIEGFLCCFFKKITSRKFRTMAARPLPLEKVRGLALAPYTPPAFVVHIQTRGVVLRSALLWPSSAFPSGHPSAPPARRSRCLTRARFQTSCSCPTCRTMLRRIRPSWTSGKLI